MILNFWRVRANNNISDVKLLWPSFNITADLHQIIDMRLFFTCTLQVIEYICKCIEAKELNTHLVYCFMHQCHIEELNYDIDVLFCVFFQSWSPTNITSSEWSEGNVWEVEAWFQSQWHQLDTRESQSHHWWMGKAIHRGKLKETVMNHDGHDGWPI